jgi:hypothetical protein
VDNSPEAFKKILEVLLLLMDVRAPKGVFTPSPRTGKPGRPIHQNRERLYKVWLCLGQPSLYTNKLASKFYGKTFKEADFRGRKLLVQRCRRAVEREQESLIKSLEAEIAKVEEERSQLRAAKETMIAELVEKQSQLKRLSR